jgi:hypothetical protein
MLRKRFGGLMTTTTINRDKLSALIMAALDAAEEQSCENSQETPEEYFLRLDKERGINRSLSVPRTANEQKVRISAAITNYQQRIQDAPDLENYLARIPENVREIARAFCTGFGRTPAKREDGYWRGEWNMQEQIGLQPGDITEAISRMFRDNLTIKSPQSVTAIAENVKRRRVNKAVPSNQDGTVYSSPTSAKYLGGD